MAISIKKAWNTINEDLVISVQEAFTSGKILKQINATAISVIPKTNHAVSLNYFRHVACCNVLYKIISKVITNKLSPLLDKIISPNQSAFVPNRSIAYNIMLAHELVKNYHCSKGYPRCLLKIDLRKPTIRLPGIILRRVGDSFVSGKGLRQGDPISPLIFVICMEALSRKLSITSSEFKFHQGCGSLNINHLIFVDDLLLFCYDENSKTVIKNALCFEEGSLPLRYLRIPLISTNLSRQDCKGIIDKITSRILSWNINFLSYASRVQLIQSVLMSMQIFWASILILPKKVIREIQKICSKFLWSGKADGKNKAMVAWKEIEKLKKEGGLSIKEMGIWNWEAVNKHVWYIMSKPNALWVKWIKYNKLKNVSYWGAKNDNYTSWMWRGLLSIKNDINSISDYELGNGKSTMFWRDPWIHGCSVLEKYPRVKMGSSGIGKEALVANLWKDNKWSFSSF
ncbi:uncharacterized protein LOC126670541 [Mercurialis annua]|uniref:uncharacterized protein LOC126670541 n=1 Tax=Mercurialis annua TaxID=3986 RepID=UPI00215ECF5D|nr:uncharacterized protein LOC126670541 [Mercurialis annua]